MHLQKRLGVTREHVLKHPPWHGEGKLVGLIKLSCRRVPAADHSPVLSTGKVGARPGHDATARGGPGRGHHFGVVGHEAGQLVQAAQGFRPRKEHDQFRSFIHLQEGHGLDHAVFGRSRHGIDGLENSAQRLGRLTITLPLAPPRSARGHVIDDGPGLGFVKAQKKAPARTAIVFGRKVCRALFSARPPDVTYDAGKISEDPLPVDLALCFALARRRNAGLRRKAFRLLITPDQGHGRLRQSKKLKEFRQSFTDKTLHAHLSFSEKMLSASWHPKPRCIHDQISQFREHRATSKPEQ